MERIHRRIASPLVTGLKLTTEGLDLLDDTVAPVRLPDLFPGAPVVVTGRCRSTAGSAAVTVQGSGRDGDWSARVPAITATEPALTAVWARAHLRDLEDRYLVLDDWDATARVGREALEKQIVAMSLRFGVLCRFTAWLAVDTRVVTEGGRTHRVTQPVDLPAGWDMPVPDGAMPMMLAASSAPMPASLTFAARPAPPMSGGLLQAGKRGRSLGLGRARRGGGQPAASPREATGDESVRVVAELTAARTQLAEEAALLRGAAGAPLYERRELLADVGSRLGALVRHLSTLGFGRSMVDRAQGLAAELEADRPLGVPEDAFSDLWTRTLALLDELASDTPPPASGKPRKEFWKR